MSEKKKQELWKFDFEAELPKVKPKGKELTVPETTWKEIVKAFEVSGNPKAKITLEGKLSELSLSTVIVKLRDAIPENGVTEIKTVRHIEGKTATGHKRYVVDAIFLKRKVVAETAQQPKKRK
jgi:hypothetical protein